MLKKLPRGIGYLRQVVRYYVQEVRRLRAMYRAFSRALLDLPPNP